MSKGVSQFVTPLAERPFYRADRRCKLKECRRVLNGYNPNDYCFIHVSDGKKKEFERENGKFMVKYRKERLAWYYRKKAERELILKKRRDRRRSAKV